MNTPPAKVRAPVLGLTGSIGSGKSYVTRCFEVLGAAALRADDIAREVVEPGAPAFAPVVDLLGADIVKPDGTLDRAEAARRVFADAALRARLEAIVHPLVREREIDFVAAHADAPLIVLEIPLLFETGAEELCDKVLVVTAGEPERRHRLRTERGMSDADIDARLAAQMPEPEKIRRADFHIDNSGPAAATQTEVERLFHLLTRG